MNVGSIVMCSQVVGSTSTLDGAIAKCLLISGDEGMNRVVHQFRFYLHLCVYCMCVAKSLFAGKYLKKWSMKHRASLLY